MGNGIEVEDNVGDAIGCNNVSMNSGWTLYSELNSLVMGPPELDLEGIDGRMNKHAIGCFIFSWAEI